MTWIKVDTQMMRKQEIGFIAQACGCSEKEAFASWFLLWGWFDAESVDGSMPYATKAKCDQVAELPGIANALEEVGWLEFLPGMGLLVIDWEKHNGNSTKKRALLALRKTRERMRTGAESGGRPWNGRREIRDGDAQA